MSDEVEQAGAVGVRIRTNGPYLVTGVPLVRCEPVRSERGEPLTWRTVAQLADGSEPYALCRCGSSGTRPFCDGTHRNTGFDGSPPDDGSPDGDSPDGDGVGSDGVALPRPAERRAYAGVGIVVTDDRSLCMHAGFCSDRVSNVWKMVGRSDDPLVRRTIMTMIEKCPSGALAYGVTPVPADAAGPADSADAPVPVEPNLPLEVALITDGPVWVTGGVPVDHRQGTPVPNANRITLCRCGASANKPYCDGAHTDIGFTG